MRAWSRRATRWVLTGSLVVGTGCVGGADDRRVPALGERSPDVLWASMPAEPAVNPLIRIIEWDDDGGEHVLPRSGAIVDLNSTLRVQMDTAALRDRLLAEYDGGAAVAPDILELISASLNSLEQSLPAMDAAFAAFASGAKAGADVVALRDAMQEVAVPALEILEQMPPRLRASVHARFDAEFGRRVADPMVLEAVDSRLVLTFQTLFDVLGEELDQLRETEVARLREAGVFVRFGAWSTASGRLTPVHLDGFDRYARGEFFEVDRFVVSLSPEQRAEWQQIVTRARAIRDSGGLDIDLRSIASRLVDGLDSALAGAVAELDRSVVEVESRVRELEDDLRERARAAVTAVRTQLAATRAMLETYRTKYQSLRDGPTLDSLALLADVRTDVTRLLAMGQGLLTVVTTQVAELRELTIDVSERFEAQGQSLVAILRGLALGLPVLASGSQVDLAALQFGEEVLALDADQIPAETSLDLRYTGPREAGDRIVFLLRSGQRDADEADRTLDSLQCAMHKVLPHVTSAVSLGFANPAGATALQTDFQGAPSYSLLFKVGSRDSSLWNRFLTPGIGLNFAALDFDGDDNLELGIGGTVSLFRDWVQVGYGYDLGTDDEYWFFGLSVPLTDFALSSR